MWRKQTGSTPRLLFRRDDLRIILDDRDESVLTLEFASTAGIVLNNLESNGFGWHASVAAYASVREGSVIQAAVSSRISAESYRNGDPDIAEQAMAEALRDEGNTASPSEDLHAVGRLFAKQWLDPSVDEVTLLGRLYYDEPLEVSAMLVIEAIDSAQAQNLPLISAGRALISLAFLFADARLIAWPTALCTLLKQLPSDTPIRYVLTDGILEWDIVDERAATDFVDEYWELTGQTVADYAEKLGLLYGALAAFQSNLGRPFWFGRAATCLGRLEELNATRSDANRKARGDALEDFVASIIECESPDLSIAEKNFRTKEEEIDLVLTNALASPFWIAFNSPTIFVECKNQKSPAGVAELRIFESKLEDRKAFVRIGIFVSVSGFTQPFLDRLKSIQSRGAGVIFAVKGEDLRYMTENRVRLSDWLRTDGFMRAFGQ